MTPQDAKLRVRNMASNVRANNLKPPTASIHDKNPGFTSPNGTPVAGTGGGPPPYGPYWGPWVEYLLYGVGQFYTPFTPSSDFQFLNNVIQGFPPAQMQPPLPQPGGGSSVTIVTSLMKFYEISTNIATLNYTVSVTATLYDSNFQTALEVHAEGFDLINVLPSTPSANIYPFTAQLEGDLSGITRLNCFDNAGIEVFQQNLTPGPGPYTVSIICVNGSRSVWVNGVSYFTFGSYPVLGRWFGLGVSPRVVNSAPDIEPNANLAITGFEFDGVIVP